MLQLEYKYVVKGDDGLVHAWKPGANFVLCIPASASSPLKVVVSDTWDQRSRMLEVQSMVKGEYSVVEETAAISSAVSRAMKELQEAMDAHDKQLNAVQGKRISA